jgi:hypothetical protein
VEILNIEEWRQDYLSAEAPGLPSASDSLSRPSNNPSRLGESNQNLAPPNRTY